MFRTAEEAQSACRLIDSLDWTGSQADISTRLNAMARGKVEEIQAAIGRSAHDCEVTLQSIRPYRDSRTEKRLSLMNRRYRFLATYLRNRYENNPQEVQQ